MKSKKEVGNAAIIAKEKIHWHKFPANHDRDRLGLWKSKVPRKNWNVEGTYDLGN